MSAKNKILKKAILEEVRKDNLRLMDPWLPGFKPAALPPNNVGKFRRFMRLALTVIAGLIFLFFLSDLELPLKASKFFQKTDTLRQPVQKISLSPTSSSSVRAYDFLVNNTNVRLTTLFGLGVRTIVIDPGHGGKDPGAIGPQGTMEKEITLDVARRLKKRLEAKSAFNIFLTREADETVSLQDRVNFSNTVGADLFISIHVNSIPEGNINTIETYYFGPPSDEKTLRVAERENADSMYSSADFKKLIQNIGNTMKQQESIALAVKIQRSLFANVRKYDKDVHNWGVKIAPFMVLLNVEAPAVLTEISCISEPEEEKKLKTADYREKIASFTEKGIAAYLTQKQVLARRGDEDEH